MKKLLFCLFLFPFGLFAQDEEVDSLKFKASLSLSGIYQTGNIQTWIFRAKTNIEYQPWKKWLFNTRNSYLYQAFDRDKADEDMVSLNFLYFNPDENFSPHLIGIVSSNFRREIDLRSLVGAGVKYKIFRKEENSLEIALSSEYEYTRFSKDTFNIEEYNGVNEIKTVRATIWVNGKYHMFKKKLIFSHESYFQPSVLESDNYRWQIDLGMELPISKYVNFKINYLHTFESIVVANQKRQDRFLTFGFTLKTY